MYQYEHDTLLKVDVIILNGPDPLKTTDTDRQKHIAMELDSRVITNFH